MVGPIQDRRKLRMDYEPTMLVDIEFLISKCAPCTEVPTTGVTLHSPKPLNYQGRFGGN